MSVIHPPMNLLRSVQQTMSTQFPHLDLQSIYRFVEEGYDVRHKNDDSTKEETDEEAERRFERRVGQYVPEFSAMLEAVAPSLRRFSGMTDSVRRYIEKKRRQIEYLTSILILSYVSVILVMLVFVFRMWRASERYYDYSYGFTRVAALAIAFLFVHSLVFSMKIALDERKEAVTQLNVGVLEKYDVILGQNVYVKFAEAYSRGPSQGKKFVTEYAEEKLASQDDEIDDNIVYDFCAQREGPDALPTRECIIDPCPPQELETVLRKQIRSTWARRNSTVSDCDRTMLGLLQALKEIYTGEVFESNDAYAMWRGIQSGVDNVRDFVYRRLDVASRQHRDRDSALKVVRDEVVPSLVLPAVECTDLVPLWSSSSPFDRSVVSKEQCWRMALEDADCAWAYFHPCKGAIFGSTDCDEKERRAGCMPAKAKARPRLEYLGDGEEDDAKDGEKSLASGTLLLKARGGSLGPDYEQFIAAKDGIAVDQDLPSSWAATGVSRKAPMFGGEDVLLPFLESSSARIVVDQNAHGIGYQSYAPSATSHYYEIFADAFAGDRRAVSQQQQGRAVFVKASVRDLYTANAARYTYSSFYALMPMLQDRVVNILKPHHHAVRLEEYREYILTELQKLYGSERFHTIKPLLDDLLHKIAYVMENLRLGSRERMTYISTTRFEEKLKGLSYGDTKRLVEEVGRLAKMTKLYANKYPAKEQDRASYRAGLLWATAGVLVLLFSLVLYNLFSIRTAPKIDPNAIFRNVAMSVCIFVFALVVLGSIISRYLANRRFNEQISDDNSKLLVASSVRAMDLLAQHLESLAHQRRMAMRHSVSSSVVKREFVEFYYSIGHVSRAKALESTLDGGGRCLEVSEEKGKCPDESHGGEETELPLCGSRNGKRCPPGQCCSPGGCCVACDKLDLGDIDKVPKQYHNPTDEQLEARTPFRTQLATTPPNYPELFLHLRRTVGSYDACNNITVPARPPFPTFEIVIYTLVAFIALALLFYSYAKIDPIGRVRNINLLNEARADIQAGYASSADVRSLAKCRGIPADVWTLVLNVTVVIAIVLIFMVVYFIVHSTQSYENSLYMSSLYGEGKCKPG